MPDIYLRSTQVSPSDIGLCDPTVPCTAAAPVSSGGGALPGIVHRKPLDPGRQPIRYVLRCLPLRIRIVVYPVRFEVRKAQRKTAVMRAREELGLAAAQTQFASRESLAVNSLADDLR